MSKSRIVNISHMLKKAFVKVKGCDQIIVAMGKYNKSKGNNSIVMMYCTNGNSDENTFQIETEINKVEDIVLMVTGCLMDSGLDFDSVQVLNMDGTIVDIEHLNTGLKMVIDIK